MKITVGQGWLEAEEEMMMTMTISPPGPFDFHVDYGISVTRTQKWLVVVLEVEAAEVMMTIDENDGDLFDFVMTIHWRSDF